MNAETKINIEIFKTVTKAIAASADLDIMCNHLSQLLVTTLDIKGCGIFILNPQTEELELLASFGLSMKYLSKGLIRASKSMAETFKGKPVVTADVSKDKTLQYPEEAKKEGIAAIISIPVVFLGEVIGTLRLYHHQVWDISHQDLDSLNLLGENIGLAMTYTRLLNAVQSIDEVINSSLPKDLLL